MVDSLPLPAGQTPRDWQVRCHIAARQTIAAGVRSFVLQAATGTGKSSLAPALAILTVRKGGRAMILAHRNELIEDIVQRLLAVEGCPRVGVVKAERDEWDAPIVVASVQSLTAKRLLEMTRFDVVITDECHHAVSYARVFDAVRLANPRFVNIGVTATAFRAGPDGTTTGLGSVYQTVAFRYPIEEAIAAGDLVPLVSHSVATSVSLVGCAVGKDGDYDEDELAKIVDTPERNALIIDAYIQYNNGAPCLVFAASILHAQHIAEAFVARGIVAESVCGIDKHRVAKIAAFKSGSLPVLCNKDLLFEGFDAPRTALILKARPTKSRIVFTQMIGRGMRIYPGKIQCTFIDFADNGCELDLMTACDLSVTVTMLKEQRPFEVGDRVLREHHDDLGVGVIEELRPPDLALVAFAEPLTLSTNELRLAPPELMDGEGMVSIEPRVTGHNAYEVFLLPGDRRGSPWFPYQGTYTLTGTNPDGQRVHLHVRPTATGWALWRLRVNGKELEANKVEDLPTRLPLFRRDHDLHVEPLDAPWRWLPVTKGQIGALRSLDMRRDCDGMTTGEASMLIAAVAAYRKVGDILDPRKAQRREWVKKMIRDKRRNA